MRTEDKELLETFQVRFRDLMKRFETLERQIRETEEKAASDLRKKDDEIDTLKSMLAASEKRYADLKTARSFEAANEDKKEIKQRVTRLVREIDKCIALLNE